MLWGKKKKPNKPQFLHLLLHLCEPQSLHLQNGHDDGFCRKIVISNVQRLLRMQSSCGGCLSVTPVSVYTLRLIMIFPHWWTKWKKQVRRWHHSVIYNPVFSLGVVAWPGRCLCSVHLACAEWPYERHSPTLGFMSLLTLGSTSATCSASRRAVPGQQLLYNTWAPAPMPPPREKERRMSAVSD